MLSCRGCTSPTVLILPAAVKGAVVVRAAPDLDQAGTFAELVDHGIEQNGNQGLVLLEELGDAGELLILAVGIELGIEADDLHVGILLGDALQEGVGAVLIAVADQQSVIAGGRAGADPVLPGVEIAVAEDDVAVHIQRLAQVDAGIGPHLEDRGGRQQHDVGHLLARDGVGGFSRSGGAHHDRHHQSQNNSENFLHGKPPYFI